MRGGIQRTRSRRPSASLTATSLGVFRSGFVGQGPAGRQGSAPHPRAQNVRRIAKELGEDLSEEELQAMIDEFDRDQDGEINLQEFTYIMKQTNVF